MARILPQCGALVVAAIPTTLAAETIQVPADYPTIQSAIDAAAGGDVIVVAPGVYNEAIDLLGKSITLQSDAGAGVTTIDATDLDASVVTCASGEGRDTVLEGLTITGGAGTEVEIAPGALFHLGGGMYTLDSGPTVSDCTFTANSADFGGGLYSEDTPPYDGEDAPLLTGCAFIDNTAMGGGGMRNVSSDPVLTGCMFRDNTATRDGGGMLSQWGSNPLAIGCSFIGNSATGWGGGMYSIDGSIPTVINSRFIRNTASYGGGMNNHNFGHAVVTNCLFIGNSANRGGGMLNHSDANPTVTNCTFHANTATDEGGGLSNNHSAHQSPTLVNCIVRDNLPDQIDNVNVPPLTVRYSNVLGGWPGVGNIDADPLFADPDGPDGAPGTEDDDLRPGPGSPCLDAGDNAAVPADAADLDGDGDTAEPVPVDFDGDPRFIDDPDTVDSGNGAPPVVDIGAFEFQTGCPADRNGDGSVNVVDLLAILGAWGPCPAEPDACPGDVDSDGIVGIIDLLEVLAAWGPCP